MKSFIFRFGLFCALFILGLTAFSTFLKVGQKYYDSHAGLKLRLLLDEKTIDPEIIVFGSSVAEGGINPLIISNITEKKSYNASLSGRRIIDWNSIAFSFLDYTKNNKVIVLDIFPNVFNQTDNLYQPHEFYPYLNNKFVKKALSPISSTYHKITTLPFYYLTQLNSKIVLNAIAGIYDLLLNSQPKMSEDYNGYNNINSNYENGDVNLITPTEISNKSIKLYEKLILQAANKNIEVLFVGMPVFCKGQTFYNQLDSVYNWGTIWSNKYENVTYLNFLNDSSIIYQQDYFANNTHLNKKGASFISSKIGNYLNKYE